MSKQGCQEPVEAERTGRQSVSLPILKMPSPPQSTMGKWRAIALILIHVAIAAHIVQWLLSGLRDGVRETLSPVEPSEAMFTLELGQLNAGFVMFALAVASTAIFGRWFCGWACHVVALQDACGWMMKRFGLHPKPWRSRLLLWVPTGLAAYMFLWPTFRREVLARYFGEAVQVAGKTRYVLPPELAAWLGEVRVWPESGLQSHFIVENFWATFAPWYVAIPFLAICGFATVYFLGAKGFCTYGCPYGGFFGPVDRVAPMRVRVTDACNHCGHCTAVCTSNVRVSDEVRNYGAVVDPGCMKCMDCISACPNDALYMGYGRPALFTKSRVSEAALSANAAKVRARYDLSLVEEVVLLVLMLILIASYRGLYNVTPLLMAVGLAAVVTFMCFKCWRLVRDANVRGPFWQLKLKGQWRAAGWAFLCVTLIALVAAAQGLTIHLARMSGDALYDQLMSRSHLTRDTVLSLGYKPTELDRADTQRAIERLRIGEHFSEGGLNFASSPRLQAKLVWLHAIGGDLTSSQRHLQRLLQLSPDSRDLVLLARIMSLRGAPATEYERAVEEQLQRSPELEDARRWLAMRYVSDGNRVEAAAELYRRGVRNASTQVPTLRGAIEFWLAVGKQDEALATALSAVAQLPASALLRMDLAAVYMSKQDVDGAVRELERAVALNTQATEPLAMLAEVYEARNELTKAAELRDRVAQIEARQNTRAKNATEPLISPTQSPN